MPQLVPDPRHWKAAREFVRAGHDRGAEGVVDLAYVADPDDLPIVVYCLARLAAPPADDVPPSTGRQGRPVLPLARPYTYEEATAAHTAYQRGDDSTWAAEGNRYYHRVRRAAQRAARRVS